MLSQAEAEGIGTLVVSTRADEVYTQDSLDAIQFLAGFAKRNRRLKLERWNLFGSQSAYS